MAAVLAQRAPTLLLRRLGRADYLTTLEAMRAFTRARSAQTPDELWLLEHPPVYTLGHAADPSHGPRYGALPVVRVERGGQVTYHGPGQVVLYTLVDLARRAIKVREFVCLMEQAVIDLLAGDGVAGQRLARPEFTSVMPKSRRSASASLGGAPFTDSRSTSTWIWRRSRRLIPAATPACA